MNRETHTLWNVVALAVVGIGAGHAAGQSLFQSNVPDFYQHQRSFQGMWGAGPAPRPAYPGAPDAEPAPLVPRYNPAANVNWWEDTGGWCATTAWVNALYTQQTRRPNEAFRLYDRSQAPRMGMMDPPVAAGDMGRPWIQRMAYANEDLAIAAGGCATADQVSTYITGRGLASQMVCYYWDGAQPAGQRVRIRQPDGSSVADGAHATLFDLYFDSLRSDNSVVVQMERQMGDTDVWWQNFHVVTAAGANAGNRTIYWADPNDTFRGADWGNGFREGDAFPDQLRDYNSGMLGVDGRTFTSGPYTGSALTELWTLRVPTPGASTLMGIGMLVMARRRR